MRCVFLAYATRRSGCCRGAHSRLSQRESASSGARRLHLGNAVGSKNTFRKQDELADDDGRFYNYEFLNKVVDGLDRNLITGRDIGYFVHVVKLCGHLKALIHGRKIHGHLSRMGIAENLHLGTQIIQMYLKCGSVAEAENLFYLMPLKDVILWTTMAAAYAERGFWEEVIRLFDLMRVDNVPPSRVTYIALLNAYASSECLPGARLLHAHLEETGAAANELVKAVVLEMYAKCGEFDMARRVFTTTQADNVYARNAMLAAAVQHRYYRLAFEIFRQMEQQYVRLGKTAYAAALDSCTLPADLEAGKRVHRAVTAEGYDSDIMVNTALITMYGNCGNIDDARSIFNRTSPRNAAMFSAMVSSLAKHGRCAEGFQLLQQMQAKCVVSDSSSCVYLLRACADLLTLEEGKAAHDWALSSGLEDGLRVASALVDFYCKCGSIEEAEGVFEAVKGLAFAAWDHLLAGYSRAGYSSKALELFAHMQLEGVSLTTRTFVSVLQACGHAGMVEDGIHHFLSMSRDLGMLPSEEHCACIISMLGRNGQLQDAEEVIHRFPTFDPAIWNAFLVACRAQGDWRRAIQVAKLILELAPGACEAYAVLSGAYDATGQAHFAAELRQLMVSRKLIQERARSSVLIRGRVFHEFGTGDESHSLTERIQAELGAIKRYIAEHLLPEQQAMLHDVSEELQEGREHSELLALALGIVKTAQGTPLRIVKNCRVCAECHSAMKLISKLQDRNIVLRAGDCLHIFQDGLCSCKDFW